MLNRNSGLSVTALCALLAVHLVGSVTPAQAAWQQLAKVVASDAATNDYFGQSVDVDGNTVVVGAYQDDHAGGIDAGSAYVFVYSGGIWTQQAKLVASDAAPGDNFSRGWAVAVDGDTVVVGACHDDHAAGADAGSAYVFVRSGGVWTQQAKLVASDAAAGDWFGIAAAVQGDTAVIGASYDNGRAGSVYVFLRSGGVWTQQAKLTASDPMGYAYFGTAVAIDGDAIAVGADGVWVGGVRKGAAYAFRRSGSTWPQEAQLLAPDGAELDNFGYSVGIAGDTAIVGAFNNDHAGGTNAGSAYVFARSGSAWTQQAKLVASDAAAGDGFGYSVTISDDTALIGAPQDDHAAGADAGSAYVFVRSAAVWTQEAKLTASDAAASAFFGFSVALDSNKAAIGAYKDDHAGGTDAGSAYVFCGNEPPVAEAGGPYAGEVGEAIFFDASGSYDPDGPICGYRWDWTSDGAWDTGWLPSPYVTHTYSAAFGGMVRLQVRNDDGDAATDTAAVSVTGDTPSCVYEYDCLGRVVRATYASGAAIVYSYDAVGNRTLQSVTSNPDNLYLFVDAVPLGSGIVVLNPDLPFYPPGGTVVLAAQSVGICSLTEWTGDVPPGKKHDNPLTLGPGDYVYPYMCLTAHFGSPLGHMTEDCNANDVPDGCEWVDCNASGTLDACDIAGGASQDANHNGIPDECDALGDLNCDDLVNIGDIDPFVLAFIDPAGYATAYPSCDINRADMNADTQKDGLDIQPFVDLLLQGG